MLHIHRAERADRLADALGSVVRQPLDDPFTPEVVAVPTRGVERWLAQRLSTILGASATRADGVCANVAFPFPGRLVGGAVAVASDVDADTDPWLPERAVWPLLQVVDAHLGEPWLASLTAHVGGWGPDRDPQRHARRFIALRHLADLYDRYAVHRPGMLRAWAAGDDTDGAGRALPADLTWQAGLWRRLRETVGRPSPAERLDPACQRLRDDPAIIDLPRRLTLFGLTRLPVSYLAVLDALAGARDVHLFLLHPSPALWRQVTARAGVGRGARRRCDDLTTALPRNPLLGSWGRDAREMQLVVTTITGTPADGHIAGPPPPATLLGRVQAAIHANAAPPGRPAAGGRDDRADLDPDDRSIQVHACHGRARQVEVVRDAVLHLLATEEQLEPRDVVIMCPDIETFAPLIHAAFGPAVAGVDDEDVPGPGTRPPGLRVRLADRSLRQTNPVLQVLSELLGLADSRFTASQVLDLAGRAPVRRRFGFRDADLERLEDWVPAAGIRWGVDAAHRAPFDLDDLEANTWRAGLERILLGVAMTEDGHRLVDDVLPLDDVGSADIDLAGRFAEFVGRLAGALARLTGLQTISAWVAALADAAESLTTNGEPEAWQYMQLRRLLDEVLDEATVDDDTAGADLALADVRALFADRLRGRPTRANFRTGHLTICTLVPMRSVPHRVVCLLGLDDGTFPRLTAPDGDDLIDREPHVGDRDLRSEDRQLLLDALLAATDHLVVTYTGRDERTNQERPPAVPVGELLEVIDRTARATDADGAEIPARDEVLVHHPLQPFDPRNFTVGGLGPRSARRRRAPGPWSFDTIALAGARALAAGPDKPEPFLAHPLPDRDADLLELTDLVRFVQHPVRAFLRQRLGISLTDRHDEPDDALPVDLGALEQWGIGQRLLRARLDGIPPPACVAAERSRGTLPPGALATPLLESLGRNVERLVAAAADAVGTDHRTTSFEIHVVLADGFTVAGTVAGVAGDCLSAISYSRVGARHRLTAWVRLLALTATHPDIAFRAATVGRRSAGGSGVTIARAGPLGDDPTARRRVALGHLGVLVDLYRRGMREPLPLYCDTSAAYAQARAGGSDGAGAGRKAWESTWDRTREDRAAEHRLVLGRVASFDELLAALPCADEGGAGWPADETTRFGRYARRLWEGLLACEDVSQQ